MYLIIVHVFLKKLFSIFSFINYLAQFLVYLHRIYFSLFNYKQDFCVRVHLVLNIINEPLKIIKNIKTNEIILEAKDYFTADSLKIEMK